MELTVYFGGSITSALPSKSFPTTPCQARSAADVSTAAMNRSPVMTKTKLPTSTVVNQASSRRTHLDRRPQSELGETLNYKITELSHERYIAKLLRGEQQLQLEVIFRRTHIPI
jgi:hypothetical protein